MDRAGCRASLRERYLQCVDHEFAAQVVGYRPAHDAAGEHVEHHREVEPALFGAVLGDVGGVEPVGLDHGESSLDQALGGSAVAPRRVQLRSGRRCTPCSWWQRITRSTRLRPTRIAVVHATRG
jgi:hypothetical protein